MYLGIAYDTWVILGVLAVGISAVSYEAWLPALQNSGLNILNWFKVAPTPPVVVDEADEDVLDLKAAKRLQKRFKDHSCPEGTAAMLTVLEHFFH